VARGAVAGDLRSCVVAASGRNDTLFHCQHRDLELIMKVRIVNRPTGLLNGRDWPDVGEVLEVEDIAGADMCAAGIGTPVVEDEVEKAVVSEGEQRSTDEAPKGNASRDEWAAYAVTQGAPDEEIIPVEDGGLSRDDLKAKYGVVSPTDTAD
jgi:hypothetical protein